MSLTKGMTEIFHTTGRRLTSQRRLLLEVLTQCDEHLDAEGIYELAKDRDPNISLATVYRTLKVFKEVGIVQERMLDHEGQRHHYEVAAKAHYHFTCLGCGRVIEFESHLIEQASDELARELDLEVVHTRVHLDGYCTDCKGPVSVSEGEL
ncbi:MAG: transcriptional repressor [Anaerolineae bacterium]